MREIKRIEVSFINSRRGDGHYVYLAEMHVKPTDLIMVHTKYGPSIAVVENVIGVEQLLITSDSLRIVSEVLNDLSPTLAGIHSKNWKRIMQREIIEGVLDMTTGEVLKLAKYLGEEF